MDPNKPLNLQISPYTTYDQIAALGPGGDWLGVNNMSGTNPSLMNGTMQAPANWGVPPVAGPTGGFMGALKGLGGWFGKNGQTIGNWANVIGQGVNAYVGLQQLGLAKDALKFEKKAFKTNLANQVDSYNTQTKDRLTGRWYATEEERQAAMKDAELPQGMRG